MVALRAENLSELDRCSVGRQAGYQAVYLEARGPSGRGIELYIMPTCALTLRVKARVKRYSTRSG